jgi:hypothetical protein
VAVIKLIERMPVGRKQERFEAFAIHEAAKGPPVPGGGVPKRPVVFHDFVSNMFRIYAVPSLLVRTSKLIFALGKEMSYSSPDGHIEYLLHRELCVFPGWDLKN